MPTTVSACCSPLSPRCPGWSGASGDFAGGKATQRAASLPVAWLSKLVSLPLLALYIALTFVPIRPAAWSGERWPASPEWSG